MDDWFFVIFIANSSGAVRIIDNEQEDDKKMSHSGKYQNA